MKHYIASPEYIGRKELPDGSNTSELYDLEQNAKDAIEKVVEWREKHQPHGMEEPYWTKALPQTLRTILESYDRDASEVAAKSYLSGGYEEKEVE